MNTCKKIAFFENIASAITNQGDSENQKKKKLNKKQQQQQEHPSSSNTIQNYEPVVYKRRSFFYWLQIIHTGQQSKKWRFCTLICEENMKRIVVRHKSYECLGLMLNTIVSNLLLCIW